MQNFSTKYPTITALILLVANVAKDAAVQGETLVQKLEASVVLVPQALALIPNVSLLGAEVSALKASPLDLEAGAELLVADLAFSSPKAQAVIAAAFPLAEALVGLVPQVSALVAAMKA